ncbi:zinc ribbon domain-containing protein [Bariatricus sp. SGI.154]|uniref:zinc ribbon domain-containing protein n=1 Tax=Bariatricus sp. SGI.154 TaxID=3420549 RepID=UPI003D064160
MAKRKIRIRSGELEAWLEVTEEEYQKYYRPWWQQKKREQRNREAMGEQGYKEESYEEWKENDMRTELFSESMEELLQKSYTAGFLTKKRVMNEGEIQQFYIEDDHEAIIEPWIWECVQLEMERRKRYLEEYGTNSFSHNTEQNPFAAKIICGECGKVFHRKGWQSSTGKTRRIWQCSERYKVKGVLGCSNRHIDEDTVRKIYFMAWNKLLECRDALLPEWEEKAQGADLLARFRAVDFMELTEHAQPIQELDADLMLRTLDHIKVYESGVMVTVFLDGTEIEYKAE